MDRPDPSPSADLLERCRGGDEAAAEEIWSRYVGRLIALARARFPSRLNGRLDPEDAVQSAYRSFFIGAEAGRFELSRSGDLWRLLATMTLHKLRRQARRHNTKRRAVAAETSWEALPADVLPADDRAPSPAEAAALADELAAIMAGLEPFARRTLELRLRGESHAEIAAATGRSERTVRRTLAEVRAVLSSRADRADD